MADDIDERLKRREDLEEEAKRVTGTELHPLVSKISKRFGALNLIRNARNQRQIDVAEIEEGS